MSEETSMFPEPKTKDSSWGYQLIIDCFGCGEEACCDLDRGYEFLDQICDYLKMTKQTQPYIFKTCERTFPGKPGYSGWIPIIESGIQVHTSYNNRFVSVDVYSCKTFDQEDVVRFVREWYQPKHVEVQFFHRGRNFLQHLETSTLEEEHAKEEGATKDSATKEDTEGVLAGA